MVAPLRPEEINYYDELGVQRDASPEQVRDAFRGLARLLHPDSQTDEQLKETAERQMRKLNRIYAVLSDAEKRRAYDEALDNDKRSGPVIVISPDSAAAVRKFAIRAILGACIVIAVSVVTWVLWDIASATDSRAATAADAPAGNADAADTIAGLKASLRIAEQERNAAQAEVTRLRRNNAPAAEAAITELPQSNPEPPRSGRHSFAGTWVFVRAMPTARQTDYPTEFIEAALSEVNGQIHGQYRSRYQILDHAISPDVNFDFTGRSEGSKITALWRGPGGAKGQIMIQLIADNQAEVTWVASELGSQQWIKSGAAVLSRRQ